jgi:CRISPR-associated protein Cmr1
MTVLTATYRIVTPMFIGNAEQKADSVRPPSIKGALRFWWRALNWGRCLWDVRGQESEALKRLYQEEARLFGSAADEDGAGQGRFLLNIQYAGRSLEPEQLPPANSGHQYLLGQGLYHFSKKYLRSALEPGELRLRLLFRAKTPNEDQKSVAQALLIMGLLGGIGSRARKGFGSLAIQALEGTDLRVPNNFDALRETLTRLIAVRSDDPPPYTAFSIQSRIDSIPATTASQNAWALLGEIGGEMQLYRSWGQNGKVAGKSAEKNFSDDHDLARQAALGEPVSTHPRRAVFGLPHNYFFSSLAAPHNKLDINTVSPQPGGGWSDIGGGRRASPLFIHLHEFPDKSQAGILALLPAQFLPEGWQIGLKNKGPVRRVLVDPDWAVLHRFMDRFTNRRALLEARP